MSARKVYLDYNATTPLHPEVASEMARYYETYANASSMHEDGRRARSMVEDARASVAALVGAEGDRLIFTSGGSEGNNTVFNDVLLGRESSGRDEVVISAIEHPCVLNSATFLASRGMKLRTLGVDGRGRVSPDELAALVNDRTALVSIMAANNEIGTLQDVKTLAAIAHGRGARFHTDAVQAAGKVPVDLRDIDADYATFSAHKIYGPKGVGALYVKKGIHLEPFIRGGHQERGLRAGTYNSPAIMGYGKAAELARAGLADYAARTGRLKARLAEGILRLVPESRVNGHPTEGLPNTLNVSFPGAEGEAILLSLDLEGIEVSTGSACASGSLEPSHVIMAIGVGPELAHGSIRFSMGLFSTEEDIDYVLEKLPPIIKRLRAMSTLYVKA